MSTFHSGLNFSQNMMGVMHDNFLLAILFKNNLATFCHVNLTIQVDLMQYENYFCNKTLVHLYFFRHYLYFILVLQDLMKL